MYEALSSEIEVAPFAGAWIEIINHFIAGSTWPVAPFAGAWIEMRYCEVDLDTNERRSLRGSVD